MPSGRHDNFTKTCVVVLRVKTMFWHARFFPSTHNSTGATALFTWGFDGIFAVKTTLCLRQDPLSIAKNNTIFFVPKRPTLTDELVGLLALFGQIL